MMWIKILNFCLVHIRKFCLLTNMIFFFVLGQSVFATLQILILILILTKLLIARHYFEEHFCSITIKIAIFRCFNLRAIIGDLRMAIMRIKVVECGRRMSFNLSKWNSFRPILNCTFLTLYSDSDPPPSLYADLFTIFFSPQDRGSSNREALWAFEKRRCWGEN